MLINSAFSDIISTDNLNLLQNTLRKYDQDILVIFDVDHVLIMPTEDYSLNRNPNRKPFWDKMKERFSKEEIKFLHSIVTSKAKWCLVDPQIIEILNELKDRSIPLMALTSLGTGRHGIIEKREDLRIQELQYFNINFLHTTPLKGQELVPELEALDGTPMLKDGIILTAEIDKALVLEHILIKRNYYPKTIIFVDDQLKNVQSIEKLCTKLGIKFHGFHYTKVSLMEHLKINKEIEELRFQILEKEHRWLTYEELYKRLSE